MTADADTIEVKIDDPDWSALVSAALLGTERTGGTAPIPAAVAGLVAGADTEQAILAAAASMAVRRRAGRTTSLDQAPLPLPAEPDPRPQLAGPPARYVGLAFEERPSLAPEVLELVRGTGRRLPDEWLPDVMALAARTDDADTALLDLGGTRAAWLARSFPDIAGDVWWGIGEDWEEAWAAATSGAARAALVRRCRERDLASRPTIPGGPLVGDRDRGTSSHPRRRRDGPRSGRRGLPRRATRGSAGGRPAHRRRTPGPAIGIGADSSAGRRGTAPAGNRRTRPQELEGLPADHVGGVRGAGLYRPAGARIRGAGVAPPLDPCPHPSRAMDSMAPGRCTGSRRPGHTIGRGTPADRGLDGGDRQVRGPGVGRGHPAQQGGPDQGLCQRRPGSGQTIDGRACTCRRGLGRRLDPSLLAGLAAAVPAPWPKALGDAVLSAARSAGREQYPGADLYELVRAAALRLPPDRADELEAVASFKDELRPALADAIETIRLRARIHEAFAAVPPLTA